MREQFRLQLTSEYSAENHYTLMKNLQAIGRDHYHYRHGSKTRLHYMNITKFDFETGTITGHLVGPDHDRKNKKNVIDVKYKITTGADWIPRIHIEFSDRTTSYEQSLGLIEHAFSRMATKSKDLGGDHPFNNNLHGAYLYSAKKRGFHGEFENVCDFMIENLQMPDSFRTSLIDTSYDLQWKGPGY